jgi:hypothetical protein
MIKSEGSSNLCLHVKERNFEFLSIYQRIQRILKHLPIDIVQMVEIDLLFFIILFFAFEKVLLRKKGDLISIFPFI